MIEGQQISGNCSPEFWNENPLLVRRSVDLFFADEIEEPELVDMALSICEGCAALAECLDAGLEERFGVWGGLRASERKVIVKEMRKKV